ncbi:MAG: peptide chain release factor 1 [Saprospiraceae bacterium]|nr:peptide chain release factor 1 [Candidatus Vicinibacter affinis]MBP6173476.1 peptide chain release factor 1 [Saprospiraceae bacterium]MBK6573564.1 peptide chain release factor 1 [Candidatus Vicinibacter affinis]MBK7302219.1 peptide chain release factor 1 [Candidatus Vicinibacter affinis]MBK7693358.1 peptide chain release factor 1 [Candidatus Vicinibacter affinis]
MELLQKLGAILERFQFLEERMADPEVVTNISEYKKISKEYKDLEQIMKLFHEYKKNLSNIDGAKEILDSGDKEMVDMASEELANAEAEVIRLEDELKLLLVPKDPEDSKDVIFEIRSGTGGNEASLFAGDLYRMYTRYFDMQGWTHEVVFENEGSVGGYNKIVMDVSGTDVYGKLKFESGAHRVQRVPDTEASGRIHTSAATVVVMPKLELEDVNINKSDLKVDTFRSSGAGGQHVNKTESGVRFTHIPTGAVAESTDSRSQHKNREIAMGRLIQKIRDSQVEQHESAIAAQRKTLVGSGDRSDKIRTYNFPQNRMTDHRINLTMYNLGDIMNGHIDDIIEALRVAENLEKLKQAETI